jgi:3-hydroxyisobutyrate dehydrogenase
MSESGSKPALGYVGTGFMGGPMARRLVDAGYRVAVWNRSMEKLAPLVAAGARAAATPVEVARASDIVFSCLIDTAAVEAVVFGANGIAFGAAAGKILVDMSSIRPDAAAAMAARLRAETGMGWVDAPVSGGIPGATEGTLAVMAGGTEADFRAVEPVVAHLARRFTLMGPNGAGQATKLINQVIVGCTVAVLAEATALAQNAGIDATRIPEALAGGRADSLPLQQFMPKMAAGDFTPESYLATMLKDLDAVLDLARDTDTALPMAALTTQLHRLMVARGHGQADGTAIAKLYREEPI